MIIFIIVCCFVYFIFFHESSNNRNQNPVVSHDYEWYRRGMYAYLSQSLDKNVQSATYICHIKFQGNFVSSNIPYFNDDNGRFFALSIMNSENSICLAIPINSLNLPRNIDIDIELIVEKHLKNDNNEKIHISNILKTIYVSNELFILMEWLEPALVIQSYFALNYNQINQSESWKSEYVKIIKECYNIIIKENQQETLYLKNTLKMIEAKNIDIDKAISEYHRRSLFTFVANDVLVSLVELIIQKINNNLVNNIYKACNDIRDIGLSLGSDDKYINKAIDILQNYYHNEKNDNKNKKDRLWALEVLGVPHNATSEEIKKAYRKKMAEVHPDKYQQLPDGIREIIEQKAQEINQAKEILGI